MSETKPKEKKAPAPLRPMPRRRPERVMLASFILMLGIAGYQFYSEGYGILIGSTREQPEGDSKLVRLSCTYFTGAEKVITHVMRLQTDDKSKASCSFFNKLPKVKNDPYEIIPGEKSIPLGPPKVELKGGAPEGETPPAPKSDTPSGSPSDAPPKP
jgi:hypothetical protein